MGFGHRRTGGRITGGPSRCVGGYRLVAHKGAGTRRQAVLSNTHYPENPMSRIRPVLLLCLRCAMALAGVVCFASPSTANLHSIAKELRVPIYLKANPKPAALLRIREVHREFQRRGFFRIGLLPLWVADGVEVEVTDPGRMDEIMTALCAWHPDRDLARAVEWRCFTLSMGSGGGPPLLEAAVAHALSDGSIRLLGKVKLRLTNSCVESTDLVCNLRGSKQPTLSLSDGRIFALSPDNQCFTAVSPHSVKILSSAQPIQRNSEP